MTNDLGTFLGLRGDWLELFRERAAIMEIDGRLPRHESERLALEDVLAAMRAAAARRNERGRTPCTRH
jgi:hypothetical protein